MSLKNTEKAKKLVLHLDVAAIALSFNGKAIDAKIIRDSGEVEHIKGLENKHQSLMQIVDAVNFFTCAKKEMI